MFLPEEYSPIQLTKRMAVNQKSFFLLYFSKVNSLLPFWKLRKRNQASVIIIHFEKIVYWPPTNQCYNPIQYWSKLCKGVKQAIQLACINCPNAQESS